MLYIAVYSLSCMTKHSPNYWVLLVGRLLGGIATSLLFSAFEAWVVAEHNSRGYDEKLLGGWRRGQGPGMMTYTCCAGCYCCYRTGAVCAAVCAAYERRGRVLLRTAQAGSNRLQHLRSRT